MPEQITQRELKQYRDLADLVREKSASQEALRKSLIARLQEGADVEPGILAADLAENHAQRLSFDALVRILGLAKAEKLKAQLPLSTSYTLKIVESN